ncbi:MAG: hypothetical protein U5L04_13250 [Trueperaceae bacterium]|nr:hypothetical protein [Trueperaceae bacterium]
MKLLGRREALRYMLVSSSCAALGVCSFADAQGQCTVTEDNPLGPFYRAGAPFRQQLAPAGMAGEGLELLGTISHCGEPLAGATIEAWQTDPDGNYARDFTLRAQQQSDADGTYRFDTVMPGRYRVGPSFRPAHIHLRVTHPDMQTLVTQLYFAGDPFNDRDFLIRPSLIVGLEATSSGTLRALFDLALRRS